jgi:DNA modification methylase
MKSLPTKNQKKLFKPGTIWKLGEHRLAYGDSRDKDLIANLVGDNKINLICTDIPYGISVISSKKNFKTLFKNKEIENDQLQTHEEYKQFNKEWLEAIIPYLAPKNSAYIFNADKMLFSLRDALIECGFKISQLLIWVKSQAVIGRLDYMPQHELILYSWHGTHKFRKFKDRSVLFYPRPAKNTLHPTMKPSGLIRRLILNSSNTGEVVFDGFSGVGTCLLECQKTARVNLAIEIDLEYCLTTIKRFESLTGIKAKQIYGPKS